MAQTLADGLGLLQTGQRDPLEQVLQYLREKTLLLVIDNFEHLLAGVDLLAEVLTRSKAIKMLVTSRGRLHLKEEWVFDVQGLRYPALETVEQRALDLADYEAGVLFLQTAQRAQVDFAPDMDDQAHIARICQLVGGMPLGIELSASWVRLLPCAEIAREIEHDLDILTTAWRDVPERHRSIQAVLDHSWELLATNEQEAFCQLTVFSASFGRAAAEAVANAPLLMLLALADKSFLQRADDGRFVIHELVKQYGHDKLRVDPEKWSTTRLRHCRYHAAFLDQRMRTLEASSYLDEIERAFDDIQAAWRFAIERKHLAEIQQLAAGFLVYYRLHSWYRAGSGALDWYQQALVCFDKATANSDHRRTIACLYESQGDLHELATAHEDAIGAYEKAFEHTVDEDFIRRGRLYGKMADTQVSMNHHELGGKLYTLAASVLENAPRRESSWWVEWFRVQLQQMELYYWENRPDAISELGDRLRPLIEQHGSVTQRLRYLYLLGMMALRRDQYFFSSDAITYTGEALTLSLETGNLSEIASRHFYHGFSHLWSDHLDDAEEHLQIAREITEQNGDLMLLTRALTYLTVVYRKRDDLEGLQRYAHDSLKISGEARMPQYTGMARAQYAWLAWRSGDLAETKRQVQAAIEDWGGLRSTQTVVPFRWFALFPLMGVALQEEDIDQAVEYARHMITPPQQRLPDDLTDLLKRAVVTWDQGQPDAANDLLHQSFELAHELHFV